MKFISKHQKLISRVLCFTVSLMLIIAVIPVSTASAASATGSINTVYISSLDISGAISKSFGKLHSSSYSVTINKFNSISTQTKIAFLLSSDSQFAVTNGTMSSIFFEFNVPMGFNGLYMNHGDSSSDVFCYIKFSSDTYSTLNAFPISVSKIDFVDMSTLSYRFDITAARLQAMYEALRSAYPHLYTFTLAEFGIVFTPTAAAKCSSTSTIKWVGGSSAVYSSSEYDSMNYLAELLSPLFKWLGGFLAEVFQFVCDNVIVPVIYVIGEIFQDCFNSLKPLLDTLFNDLFFPILDSILDSIVNIATAVADALSPFFSDVINYFAPHFTRIIDSITGAIIDLADKLSPIFDQFIEDISPAFDNIVTGVSNNIKQIITECFIPDNDSEQVQEFTILKDELTNKMPIFNQLKSFLLALFNQDIYESGTEVLYSNLVNSYGSFSNKNVAFDKSYYASKDLPAGKYRIVFDVSFVGTGVVYLSSGTKYVCTSGVNSFEFELGKTSYNDLIFRFYFRNCQDGISLKYLDLYSLSSSLGTDYTVNLYGINVSVLSFDWYLPYKRYGDICVIAFCYLLFIWRTFKRLPSLI